MDYPVKHFESSDGGAPVLNRTVPGSLISVLKACLIDGYNLQPVASLAMAGNGEDGRAEFAGNHGFRQHQVVEISGASGAAWNGQHRVTATGLQWVEFELEGQPAPESGAGIEIKAAAAGGWAMPLLSTEEDRAAFRAEDPSSTRMFWYLDDRRSADIEGSPTTSANLDFRFLRGAEDMPDIDTRVDDWGDGYIFVGTSSRGNEIPYDIIADDRAVYLITHPIDSTGEYRTVHAFGDFVSGVPGDPYAAFLMLARYGTTTTTSGLNGSRWAQMTDSGEKRVARDHLASPGDGVAVVMHGAAVSDVMGQGGYSYPNPANLELFTHAEVMLAHGSVLRGRVPGVAQPLHSAPMASRAVARVGGRWYKAVKHASTIVAGPSDAETLFDISGPWR